MKCCSVRPDALHALGVARLVRGETRAALPFLRRAAKLDTGQPDFLNSLGLVLLQLKRYPEAIEVFDRARRLAPRDPGILTHSAEAYYASERWREAYDFFQEALDNSNGDHRLPLLDRLGEMAAHFRLHAEASRHHSRIVRIAPSAAAFYTLGSSQLQAGKGRAGIRNLRRALDLDPDLSGARSSLLLALHYYPPRNPHILFEEHRVWDRYNSFGAPFAGTRGSASGAIRIGYVSADFRGHAVASFLEPVLRHHDRNNVEVYCYSNVDREDSITRLFQRFAHRWRPILDLTDDQAARLIYRDRIDVLVDLSGHTGGHRLPIFARKPAPVQATWLGYPNTTGLSAIDYRFTDAVTDPPGLTEKFHTETLVRLDPCFLCYQPPSDAPSVSRLPALRSGYITFGCFASRPKLTSQTLEAWAAILHDVPRSRLILKCHAFSDPGAIDDILRFFARRGIASRRLEVHAPIPTHEDHLGLYRRIDIALDPFPYTGTTTTCEALWMGVPVISLAGRLHFSRVGLSLLNQCGLPDLVSFTKQNYVRSTVSLASDFDRLRVLRRTMRDRLRAAPLLDATGFTRRLEHEILRIRGESRSVAPA